MQADHTTSKIAHLRVAADDAILNLAKLPVRVADRTHPNRAGVIFNERVDAQSGQLRVLSQFAVLPACKPAPCADPKRPVTRGDQLRKSARRKRLIPRWLPW